MRLPAGPSQRDTRTWQWWVRRLPDPQAAIGADDRRAAADPGCWARWVIARRRPQTPTDRDYYLAWGPPGTPVEELVLLPGARWRVEEAIKLGKSACGLADYEVRSHHGWYRHITLAQLAAAFLAVQQAATAVTQDDLHCDGDGTATHTGVLAPSTTSTSTLSSRVEPVGYSTYEIRRLLLAVTPLPSPSARLRHALAWSRWRRRQAVARACHRARQVTARPPPTQGSPRVTAIYD
ncbi:hypothetical protein [Acrocarpospora sp. B8E8]|uniref:hypothetical protein n=1 Tax=Acrocarpospora sp. B8E8 TaxID=3153572 RepID=UPI00325C8471